jgi:hypothetical protein
VVNHHREEELPAGCALDHEIRTALAVEHSPEFLARVRARIADEPKAKPSQLHWDLIVVGAAAAGAILLAVSILPGPRDEQSDSSGVPVTRVSVDAGAFRSSVAPERPFVFRRVPSTAAAPRIAIAKDGQAVSRTAYRAPEVLVSAAEAKALRQLLASISEGHLDLSGLADAVTSETSSEPVQEIAIDPIVIEPLAPVARLEGERP